MSKCDRSAIYCLITKIILNICQLYIGITNSNKPFSSFLFKRNDMAILRISNLPRQFIMAHLIFQSQVLILLCLAFLSNILTSHLYFSVKIKPITNKLQATIETYTPGK